jgi:hypothetical protein
MVVTFDWADQLDQTFIDPKAPGSVRSKTLKALREEERKNFRDMWHQRVK